MPSQYIGYCNLLITVNWTIVFVLRCFVVDRQATGPPNSIAYNNGNQKVQKTGIK